MTTQTPSGLYEQLKDDLGYLKLVRAAELLPALLDRAHADGLTHAQFLAELVAEEAAATRNRRMAARLRFAHFPARRTLEEFDFDFQPSVDRKLVQDLASLRFVVEGRPLLLLGQPGCGKSHLGIALATLAVEAGYRGYFRLFCSIRGWAELSSAAVRRSPPMVRAPRCRSRGSRNGAQFADTPRVRRTRADAIPDRPDGIGPRLGRAGLSSLRD
jgi:hypothetical protein